MSVNNEKQRTIEEQFADDCKVINMKYEYNGYTGNEKWAIISELTENEILEKYRPLVDEYIPFLVLTPAFGEVRDEFRRNEKKYYMRSIRSHIYALDDEFEEHHPEFAVEDCTANMLIKEQNERLGRGIKALDKKQRDRLIAYFFEGKTFREIGKMEGVDHKAIVQSVQVALKNLRNFLK